MKSPWFAILLALLVDGAAGLAGALLSDTWLKRNTDALISLAAGALITAALLDILPEAVQAVGPQASSWMFGGFVAALVFEWGIGRHHHRHQHNEHVQGSALPPVLLGADAFHNIGDGAAIAAAFLSSYRAGVITAVAVIAHEVPQEVGDYAILRRSGYPRWRALLALAAVQLTAFIGAAGVMIASAVAHRVVGYVLAIASGSFLFIGATDLLPEMREKPTQRRAVGFVLGVAAILLMHE